VFVPIDGSKSSSLTVFLSLVFFFLSFRLFQRTFAHEILSDSLTHLTLIDFLQYRFVADVYGMNEKVAQHEWMTDGAGGQD
jgi:hypothetical protein